MLIANTTGQIRKKQKKYLLKNKLFTKQCDSLVVELKSIRQVRYSTEICVLFPLDWEQNFGMFLYCRVGTSSVFLPSLCVVIVNTYILVYLLPRVLINVD